MGSNLLPIKMKNILIIHIKLKGTLIVFSFYIDFIKEEQTLNLKKILNKVSNLFLAFFLVVTSLFTINKNLKKPEVKS